MARKTTTKSQASRMTTKKSTAKKSISERAAKAVNKGKTQEVKLQTAKAKSKPVVSTKKSSSGTQYNYSDGTGYWVEKPKKAVPQRKTTATPARKKKVR